MNVILNIMKLNKLFCLFIICNLLVLGYMVTSLAAQEETEPDSDPFYTQGQSVPLSAITERVDPFSGYLTVAQTDIHLPGNGGLDLNIIRTYSSAIWGRRDTTLASLVGLNERSLVGLGWSLHMGIVRNPFGTGSANRFIPDNPVVEMPDGSRHVLFRDQNHVSRFISKSYWRYEKIANGKWELTLTDGTVYTFEFNDNVAIIPTEVSKQALQWRKLPKLNIPLA